ncbi:hypothetical protein IOD13_03480 [Brevibacterium casei]|nr:hypothetical protein [Brevibacterium casei]
MRSAPRGDRCGRSVRIHRLPARGLRPRRRPRGLALMRSMPSPWGEFWVNRSKGVDILTCLIFTALLVGLAIVVPQSR